MELKRRLSLVVAIMSVALGSGHLVQSVLVKPAKIVVATIKSQPKDIMLVAAGADATGADASSAKTNPVAVQIPTTSFAAAPAEELPSVFTLPNDPVLQPDFKSSVLSDDISEQKCPVTFDLKAEPLAMIGVSLVASCHPNARVVLQHAGLSVTGKTNGTGALDVSLPALSVDAQVSVRFLDGHMIEGKLAMPEAAEVRRFGVQWLGDDAFQLNAFENGAGYGEIGHVSAADPQRALAGKPQIGGFLSVLGDDQVDQPMLAEVYTYPTEPSSTVKIVIEAAITKSTCARDMLGETLAEVGSTVTITDLTVAMPACDAVGDILVLENIDPDLKIASAN